MKKYRRSRTKRKFKIIRQNALREASKLFEFCAASFILIGLIVLVFANKSEVQADSTQIVSSGNTVAGFVPKKVEQLEFARPDIALIPTELPANLEEKKTYIVSYLKSKGEDVDRWMKIIKGESQFDPSSKAQTYWSLCDRPVVVKLWGYQQPANSYIELRDYPNGIWQATCEEAGATTLKTGYSAGLVHIIETTWDGFKCKGDRMNWIDNLECAFKIRDGQGWKAWSTN